MPRSRIIVYELTPYGHELEPVVLALGAWGFKAMGDPREGQVITPDSMTMELRTAFRPQVAANLPATAYAARFGPAGTDRSISPSPPLLASAGSSPATWPPTARSPRAWSRCCAVAASFSAASRTPSTWPPDPGARRMPGH
jgi:hypothetical protein